MSEKKEKSICGQLFIMPKATHQMIKHHNLKIKSVTVPSKSVVPFFLIETTKGLAFFQILPPKIDSKKTRV